MHTLRRRLSFTHTLVTLVALAIVSVLTTVLVRRDFDQLARRQAQAEAQFTAERLADFYRERQSWAGVASLFQEQFSPPPGQPPLRRRLQIVDDADRLLFDSFGTVNQSTSQIDGARQSVTVDGRVVGTVIIGHNNGNFIPAEVSFLSGVYVSVAASSVLAGGVALMVGLLISGRVTRPLNQLTLAAQWLAAGERHQPLVPPRYAELAKLAHAFNTMAAELDHQSALRRQLVADIAHELRTPLSVLQLQIESIQDGVAEPTVDMVASLGEEVALLTRLVEDLRLLSLADAGQLSFALEPVNPQAALERAAAAALPRARQQGIALEVAPSDPLPYVRADPQRLAQVLGNLIENALHYTPRGGRVRLHAELASETAGTQLMVQLAVSDTGHGIAPEDLPSIFERFYRADRARSRETGGSGLGLAIVQRLLETQGGNIHVESELGKGSTFVAVLPATPEETQGHGTPNAYAKAGIHSS